MARLPPRGDDDQPPKGFVRGNTSREQLRNADRAAKAANPKGPKTPGSFLAGLKLHGIDPAFLEMVRDGAVALVHSAYPPESTSENRRTTAFRALVHALEWNYRYHDTLDPEIVFSPTRMADYEIEVLSDRSKGDSDNHSSALKRIDRVRRGLSTEPRSTRRPVRPHYNATERITWFRTATLADPSFSEDLVVALDLFFNAGLEPIADVARFTAEHLVFIGEQPCARAPSDGRLIPLDAHPAERIASLGQKRDGRLVLPAVTAGKLGERIADHLQSVSGSLRTRHGGIALVMSERFAAERAAATFRRLVALSDLPMRAAYQISGVNPASDPLTRFLKEQDELAPDELVAMWRKARRLPRMQGKKH